MKTSMLAAGLGLVLCGTLPAGDVYYPDSNPAKGGTLGIPWGTVEIRYQAFVPAAAFGGKKMRIVGLAFAAGATGTFTSSRCEIRMAHKTTRGLSRTFANNLQKNTTVVFSGKISWKGSRNQWSPVGLTAAFAYNGVDNVVVEVRHLAAAAAVRCRTGAVVTIFKSGKGAYTSPTAGNLAVLAAPKMRFTYQETLLAGSGSPAPGGTVNLDLLSTPDPNRPYQLGSSLGNGPILIDTRKLYLSPDNLLVMSVGGYLPMVFERFAGTLDAQGKAQAKIHIPNIPALKGVRIYTAFVTLLASAPSGVANISNTFMFTIQ